ncbi:hypothetical protein OSB04_024758 [Centaurea solstitialis]|uniref:Pulmonary surfactant-associated protein B n=1 Tax=Centaurea solstitialis TaxID=347529 RepID=A0AA38SYF5_9ASTR|nr:hypothetical protein OSB04_024758 [Centaurea solstitialis]
MGGRIALIFVFLLAAGLACDAGELTNALRNKLSAVSVLRLQAEKRSGVSGNVVKNDNLCTLCETYAGEALFYLQQNKTQTEILSILHQSCSKLQSLQRQCITLVDYYAPLFFLEVSSVKPSDFCGKVNLCNEVVAYAEEFKRNSCDLCQVMVSEAVALLKNPDTQLQILAALIQQCNAVEKYIPTCKTLVFTYAPLILANAEILLETEDVCGKLHACDDALASIKEVTLVSDN